MKKFILLPVFIFFVSSSLYAFNWEEYKIKVERIEKKENETITYLKGPGNIDFTVRSDANISDKNGEIILKLNKELRSWKYINTEKIDFVVLKGKVQAVVIPSSYSYQNINILEHLPAGMLFSFDEGLRYNFRITVQNIFIRIKGRFINEVLLSEKILKAIKDPVAYLTTYNPRYMLKKIMGHQNEIEKLKEGLKSLKKKHEKLLNTHEKLKNAVLTLHNTGFLGFGVTEIDKKVIKRIIQLKKSNPKITKDQISEKLEKEKLKASSQEIFLILSIYFNEFE